MTMDHLGGDACLWLQACARVVQLAVSPVSWARPGIGTGHASVGDQDQARKILDVPAEYDVAFLLGVGYSADRPLRPIAKPSRRPLGEVIHHGRW